MDSIDTKVKQRLFIASTPYVIVRMSATKKSTLASLDYLSLIKPNGDVLHKYKLDLQEGIEDEIVVRTDSYRMPSDSFYLRLEGTDSRGNPFHRLRPVLVSPASTDIQVTATSSSIEACPGGNVSADFLITNFGASTSIHIEVSDVLEYLTSTDDIT